MQLNSLTFAYLRIYGVLFILTGTLIIFFENSQRKRLDENVTGNLLLLLLRGSAEGVFREEFSLGCPPQLALRD